MIVLWDCCLNCPLESDCDTVLQVGVKKAVHPIRFASDSRIALLAAVVNPSGSDCLRVSGGGPPYDAVLPWTASFYRVVTSVFSAIVRFTCWLS